MDHDDFSNSGDSGDEHHLSSARRQPKRQAPKAPVPSPPQAKKKGTTMAEKRPGGSASTPPPQPIAQSARSSGSIDFEKVKLVPADRVFHRIFWNTTGNDDDEGEEKDSSCSEKGPCGVALEDFDLGYEDRFKGVLFMPVTKFRHTGDETSEIPFHRVRVYRYKKCVVWDREKRVDRLDDVFNGTWQPSDEQKSAAGTSSATTTTSNKKNEINRSASDRQKPDAAQESDSALVRSLRTSVPSAPVQSLAIISPEVYMSVPSPSSLGPAKSENHSIKVATFNILFDLFTPELICTEQRIPLIVRELEQLNADVFCLQEVTPKLFDAIRRGSNVLRQRYFWTMLPRGQNSCQVVLSRQPIVSAATISLSRNKVCVFATIQLSKATSIVVAACHLISDYAGEASVGRRVEELAKIFTALQAFPRALLMGDFNFGDDNPEQGLVNWPPNFADCYLATRRQPSQSSLQEGEEEEKVQATFDLTKNWLADVNSKAHRYPRRLDRILCAGFRVIGKTQLFGDSPTLVSVATKSRDSNRRRGGDIDSGDDYDDEEEEHHQETKKVSPTHVSLFPSDHFGVVCTVECDEEQVAAAADAEQQHQVLLPKAAAAASQQNPPKILRPLLCSPSQKCAVCFIPPSEIAAKVDMYRQRWDPSYPRWMPHVNLLWPFVAHEHIPTAIDRLETLLAHQRPFTITLGNTQQFPGGRRPVVFLSVSTKGGGDEERLTMLVHSLKGSFPTCGRSFVDESAPAAAAAAPAEEAVSSFTPHMTIARCDSIDASKAIRSQVDADWQPVEFIADRVFLIAHYEGAPRFEIVHEFPLLQPRQTKAQLKADVASAAGPNKPTQTLVTILEDAHWGSRRLEPYVPNDSLERWALSVSIEDFARSAPTHISQRGGMYHIPSDKIDDYLVAWATAVQQRQVEPFYMEEVRGNPFRLYLDIDVKRTVHEPYDATELIVALCKRVSELFVLEGEEEEALALITECHGVHQDASSASNAQFKSGYRIYFQRIFVDMETYSSVVKRLAEDLESGLLGIPLPSSLASTTSTSWSDVLDDGSLSWDRGRLFGTVKRRRNQQRVHTFRGIYGPSGFAGEATEEYRQHQLKVLYGQVLRVWESPPNHPHVVSRLGNAFTPSLLRRLR